MGDEAIPNAVYAPYSGLWVWMFRIYCFIVAPSVLFVWSIIEKSQAPWALAPFVAVVGIVFELYCRNYRTQRETTFRTGAKMKARVVSKRTTMRGGFPVICAQFRIGEREHTKDAYVSYRAFLKYRAGDAIPIRVRVEEPGFWLAEIDCEAKT